MKNRKLKNRKFSNLEKLDRIFRVQPIEYKYTSLLDFEELIAKYGEEELDYLHYGSAGLIDVYLLTRKEMNNNGN